jgi:hypothetical protein
MKKNIFLAIVLIVCFLQVSSQGDSLSDLRKLKVNGVVKSITDDYYYVIRKTGKLVEKTASRQQFVFNDAGNILLGISDNPAVNEMDTTFYFYDSYGKLTKVMHGLTTMNYYYYEQNDSGWCKKEVQEHRTSYSYSMTITKYDFKNNTVETIWQSGDTTAYRNTYDQRNNLIRQQSYRNGIAVNTNRYSYDKGNDLREVQFSREKDRQSYSVAYQYDQTGNVLEIKHKAEKQKITIERNVFERFDRYKNWTKKTIYRNGKISGIILRVIKY